MNYLWPKHPTQIAVERYNRWQAHEQARKERMAQRKPHETRLEALKEEITRLTELRREAFKQEIAHDASYEEREKASVRKIGYVRPPVRLFLRSTKFRAC